MRGRVVSLALTALFAVLVAAYLVLPGMWQWGHAEARVEAKKPHQIEVTAGTVDVALVERLRNTSTSPQAGPVIITYHDVGYNPSPYTVTPEHFAEQMKLIHDAGWVTLTAAQLDAWLYGAEVPPHSVMITFDDGCKGIWQYADPVLKRYGLHATAYIITGFVGEFQPYYLTWDELGELARSGRWDIEAHTHIGHVKIPAGPNGETGPFLTTLKWLPEQNRVETLAEYRHRVETDLAECKHQLIAHGIPQPLFFAFPFSAYQGTPEITETLRSVTSSLFRATMLDDADGIVATSSNNVINGLVQRMDITADQDLNAFAHKLDLASPRNPLSTEQPPLTDPSGWKDKQAQVVALPLSEDGATAIFNAAPGDDMVRNYVPVRAAMWNEYTVSVDVGGLEGESMAGVSVLKPPDGDGRADVTLHADSYSVSSNVEIVEPQLLTDSPTHHLVIAVTPETVVVTIDDMVASTIVLPAHPPRTIAGGIALYAIRAADTSPALTFSNLIIT